MSQRLRLLVFAAALAGWSLLAPGLALAGGAEGDDEGEEPVLLGAVSREEIEAAVPGWVAATVEAEPDREASAALASSGTGAEITVYLGTWCSDSRREVPRLWRALDEVGGLVPFRIEYVAVDREKEEPAGLVAGVGLRYVPTFVVRRAGREVGRIVEESPAGIERDLLALLTGEVEGLITAKEDLAPEADEGGGDD